MEVNSLSRLDKLCAVSTDGQVQSNTLLADLEVSEEDDPSMSLNSFLRYSDFGERSFHSNSP